VLNALTIDVEDYFQVTAFEHAVDRANWENMEARIERNCDTILSLLAEYRVKATFFVLGWIAERYPILIRTMFNEGHEIASHGYDHTTVQRYSKAGFEDDIIKTKKILEDITGNRIKGYRAPSFSINSASRWALHLLYEHGHSYDSSIFPIIKHDYHALADANRFPHIIALNQSGYIKEFPPSTIKCFGINLPIAGGGYLRLLPLGCIEWGIKKINDNEKQPAIIYIHPWELDPGQPRISANLLSRFRHYVNLDSTEKKLHRLFKNFRFTTLNKLSSEMFGEA
jgi:polysaccharide deacetylase family protein (PEP-CTERM system associated)